MSSRKPKKPPPGKPPVEVQVSFVPEGKSHRSAVTGRYVSRRTATKHAKQTIVEGHPRGRKSSENVKQSRNKSGRKK